MWENEGKCAGVTSPYRRREKKGRGRIPRVTGKTLADFFFFCKIFADFLERQWTETTKEGLGLGSSGSTSSSKRFALRESCNHSSTIVKYIIVIYFRP